MNKDILLGIDIGTTAIRAFAFNTEGKIVGQSKIEINIYHPKPNWAEQDPEELYNATIKAINTLTRDVKKHVKAIGFCGQLHGLCCLDKNGKPLTNLIPWADVRAGEQAKKIEEILGAKEIYKRTGCPPLFVYVAPKILWIKENLPNIFSKCKKFLSAQDYVIFRLFGEHYTNPSIASGSQLLNINSIKWDEKILETIGITEDNLPILIEGDKIFEKLPANVATQLGLEEGIPVALGASDGALSNVGLGAVKEGICAINLGSSGAVRIVSKHPMWDNEKMRFFCYYVASKHWLCGGAVNNCGIVLKWYKDNFAEKEKEKAIELGMDVYKILDEQAEKIPAGCNGLMFLPFMSGERFPIRDPYVRGMLFGLSLGHKKEHIIRSIIEGVSFTMKWIADALEEYTKIDLIKIGGGGAKSRLWRQIISDIFEKKVVKTNVEEASALGAAILAGIAIGEYKSMEEVTEELVKDEEERKPILENVKIYKEIFKIFKEAYSSSREYCEKLLKIEME
ncbi:MAG: xylulokinase [Nitrososphaerota archaeon]